MSPTLIHYHVGHANLLPLLICKFPRQHWAMTVSFLKVDFLLIHRCTPSTVLATYNTHVGFTKQFQLWKGLQMNLQMSPNMDFKD